MNGKFSMPLHSLIPQHFVLGLIEEKSIPSLRFCQVSSYSSLSLTKKEDIVFSM